MASKRGPRRGQLAVKVGNNLYRLRGTTTFMVYVSVKRYNGRDWDYPHWYHVCLPREPEMEATVKALHKAPKDAASWAVLIDQILDKVRPDETLERDVDRLKAVLADVLAEPAQLAADAAH